MESVAVSSVVSVGIMMLSAWILGSKAWSGWRETLWSVWMDLLSAPLDVDEEKFVCADGEHAVILWPTARPRRTSRHVWVILPGGMVSGNSFYVKECLKSGTVCDSHDWCIFHQPGVLSEVRQRPPGGLTETVYCCEFISSLQAKGKSVSLLGFSAGSMLTLKMVEQSDLVRSGTRCPLRQPIVCAVAVHGPDKIRHVFEEHRHRLLRLDIVFAYSLFCTLKKARVDGAAGGRGQAVLGGSFWPWLQGWSFMVKATETLFERKWSEMEEDLWSCSSAMRQPVQTPVLRILSKNDPVVPFDCCVDPSLFGNLAKVRVLPSGGHCAPFAVYPNLGSEVNAWARQYINHDTKGGRARTPKQRKSGQS